MKKLVTLLTLVLLAPVTHAVTFEQIAEDVTSKFTPVRQRNDELIWHSGHEPFAGDCDDYATAMISRLHEAGIPYQAYIVKVRASRRAAAERHLVVCSNDVCSDSYVLGAWGRYQKLGSFRFVDWRAARIVGGPDDS